MDDESGESMEPMEEGKEEVPLIELGEALTSFMPNAANHYATRQHGLHLRRSSASWLNAQGVLHVRRL